MLCQRVGIHIKEIKMQRQKVGTSSTCVRASESPTSWRKEMFYEYYRVLCVRTVLPCNQADSLSGSTLDVLLGFFSKNCRGCWSDDFSGLHITDKAKKTKKGNVLRCFCLLLYTLLLQHLAHLYCIYSSRTSVFTK